MVEGDVRDDGRQWCDDVSRIKPSAKSGFPNHEVAFLLGKKFQCHDRDDFKESQVIVGWKFLEQRLNFFDKPDEFSFRNQLAIDLNTFAKRNQMRRSKKSDAQASRAINAFEHRTGRAFAVRAGDVDKTEFVLRI